MSRSRLQKGSIWSLLDLSWAASGEGLSALLDQAADWFGAWTATLFLRSEQGHYILAAQTKHARVPVGTLLDENSELAWKAIRSQRPMLIEDPTDSPDLIGKSSLRPDLGSSMIIPLTSPQEGCIGVLNVTRKAGSNQFDQRDLRQAGAVAQQIALAVSNTRLFEKLEHEMQEATKLRKTLESVIQAMTLGVVVCNLQGRIILANQSAEKWVAAGQIKPPFRKAFVAAIKQAALGKKTSKPVQCRPSKSSFILTAAPIADVGAVITIQDVTAHESSVRELERVKRLAEIGQMTAAIAHEIRNPLTGICSAAQLLQDNSEEAGELGRLIQDEALKLNSLCDDFLDFAKPLTVDVIRFNMDQLIQKVVKSQQDIATKAGVKIEVRSNQGGTEVSGDPRRLEQVLHNLILNAIQASPHGHTISIEAKHDSIRVSDTGAGLSREALKQLFTPFYTTKPNGTGLGLSMARKIMDAHGGQILVDSHPGKGTTFTLQFRRARKAA